MPGRRPPPPEDEGPTMEELQQELDALKKQLEEERQERNYYQLERDKITSMWEISKNELAQVEASTRNKDREMEELEEEHQVQIKVYKQKVKHMLYDHSNRIKALQKASDKKMEELQNEHNKNTADLENAKRDLKYQMKESEQEFQNDINSILESNSAVLRVQKEQLEEDARKLHANYVKKAKTLQNQLELRRKTEIAELRNRKNIFIQELMANHKRAFNNIKEYYKEITTNNMNLIISLKERVEVLREAGEKGNQEMFRMQQQLDEALQPLQDSLQQEAELTNRLKIFEKTRESWRRSVAQLKVCERDLERQEYETRVLETKFKEVQGERDELYEKFAAAITTVQQKSGLKNMLLEKKLEGLVDEVTRKEAQLGEVMEASALDPQALQAVTRKLEDVLDSKNSAIRQLEFELARVAKAHNDAINVYNAKLAEFGIPIEEVGVVPVIPAASTAPAGLATG